MNKWPPILCAIHCALSPLLTVVAGSWAEHNPLFEIAELVLITIVFLALLRTTSKLLKQKLLFVIGTALTISLGLSLAFLPHGFEAISLIGIAGYQLLAERFLCRGCQAT